MPKALIAAVMVIATWPAFSQAPTPSAFEVASVKAVDPKARRGADFRLSPGGRLTASDISLEQLVLQAYGLHRLQLAGGPGWFTTDGFDIVAKAEGNPGREQMMLMLQTLLVDRFQLKVHKEIKEGKVYALVVAKNGPKLKESADGDRSFIRVIRYDPPERPSLTYAFVGQRASVPLLIERLKGQLQTPVIIDNTGVKGLFDFRLEFAADDPQAAGPSLYIAIQEQLGLKLESARGPIETLVIDHAGKPADN